MLQHLHKMNYNLTPSNHTGYLNSPPRSRSPSEEGTAYDNLEALKRSLISDIDNNNQINSNSRQAALTTYDLFFQKQQSAEPQQTEVDPLQNVPQLSNPNIDISNIRALDDIQLDDFEVAYNMLTRLQAQYVQSQIEQLKQMQEQNIMAQKSRSAASTAKVSGYQTDSLFSKFNRQSQSKGNNRFVQDYQQRPDSPGSELLNSLLANNNVQTSSGETQQPQQRLVKPFNYTSEYHYPQQIQSGSPLPGFDNELLSQNESNALQGFLDDFLNEPGEEKDEFDSLISGLSYGNVATSESLQQNNDYINTINTGNKYSVGSNESGSDYMYVSKDRIDAVNVPHLGSNSPKSLTHAKLTSEVTNTSLGLANGAVKSVTSGMTPKITRTRKTRKKLLSEEEKRFNHTSSEKKRRLLIKSSFDNLVSKLPLEELKRQNESNYAASGKSGKSSSAKMSKFVVLDMTGNQIELLIDLNKGLKQLCLNNNINYSAISSVS